MTLNETHDVSLKSWVESANDGVTDFPIQNLPFAIFRRCGTFEDFRGGVAIGNQVLDLSLLVQQAGLSGMAYAAAHAASQSSLNEFMRMGDQAWSALRLALSRGLRVGASKEVIWQKCLIPQAEVEYALPAWIGDYTDFYTSIHHATNVGKLFRPDQPLMPNYQWVPIGYHGRSSSIVVSGHDIMRPRSQIKAPSDTVPKLGASQKLDYELELGAYIGVGNELGESVAIDDWTQHVFGLCVLNDWSARDVQAWEYQPLGPFLSKNFATSVSPWIVTIEALQPYMQGWQRPADHPQPLDYLDSEVHRATGALNIGLDVWLQTESMREHNQWHHVSHGNYADAYWTLAQMVAHHTINGCNLQAGDLLGTGTQSGPELAQAGALIELTTNGQQPLQLPNGETRGFLCDGDSVKMTATCVRNGFARIGFGEVVGTILPAVAR